MKEITKEEIKKGINAILESFPNNNQDEFWYEKEILDGSKESMNYFFREFIEQHEGSTCCADKARFITNGIFKMLETNKNLSLQQTYYEANPKLCEKHGWSHDEIAYWCPLMFDDTRQTLKLYMSYIGYRLKSFAQLLEEALDRRNKRLIERKEN